MFFHFSSGKSLLFIRLSLVGIVVKPGHLNSLKIFISEDFRFLQKHVRIWSLLKQDSCILYASYFAYHLSAWNFLNHSKWQYGWRYNSWLMLWIIAYSVHFFMKQSYMLIIIPCDVLLQLFHFLVLLVHDCSDHITNGDHTNYLLVENWDVSNVLVCWSRKIRKQNQISS